MNLTPFVREQHAVVQKGAWKELLIPREDVYPVTDAKVAERLGITTVAAG